MAEEEWKRLWGRRKWRHKSEETNGKRLEGRGSCRRAENVWLKANGCAERGRTVQRRAARLRIKGKGWSERERGVWTEGERGRVRGEGGRRGGDRRAGKLRERDRVRQKSRECMGKGGWKR